MIIIYNLKNKINDKSYIGQTSRPLKQRWARGEGYKACLRIGYAIQKYGKDNFYYDVLLVCHTQEIANY